MGKPQVTLTFAGDSTKLESAFDKVGASARKMDTDVGKASRDVGDGIDNTGQKAGDLESGFRGVTDSMSGFAKIAKGDVLGGLTDLAGGAEALATGFSGVVVPALQKSVAWLGRTRVGMLVSAVATNAMTVAQKALNLAMRLNPIGLIITALVLLAIGIKIAWERSSTFRSIVQGAMKGVQTAFGWVTTAGGKVIDWFKTMPGKIGGFVKGVASIITAPYRAAFDGIKSAWNSTVGGKGFSVPGWIPGLGGKDFKIPYFHQGGIVPGAPGTETLAMLQAGERVTAANRVGQAPQPTGDVYVTVEIDGQQLQGRITKTVRDTNRELKRTVKAA